MRAVPVLAVSWLLLAVACGGARPQPTAAPGDRPRTTLEVDNRYGVEVELYAMDRTQRVHLGSVPARRTRTLTIPAHLVAEGGGRLRFLAKAPGSDNLLAREEELLVREGEALSLTLQ
ncbi:MAG TPA: hypothetical protein VK539_31870 [Myxococcaceae bacterium]|nr:hypothetical protein [Myxococcaceae bacterium]